MRIGIVGDGPAGQLAAALCEGAGHRVHLWGMGKAATQSPHIHIYDQRLPDVLQDLGLGCPQPKASKLWSFRTISEHGNHDRSWRGKRCSREDAMALLPHRPVEDELAQAYPSNFDLLIDASGGARHLLRQCEVDGFEVSLLDFGREERYRTWSGLYETAQKRISQPSLIRLNGDATTYIELDAARWRLTLIEDAAATPLSPPAILDRLAKWGGIELTSLPKCRQMIGPVARRVIATESLKAGTPIVPFGDALVQTSPSLGFGLLSVAQQACLLKDGLDQGASIEALAASLDGYAESLWHEVALQAFLA